jgi:hypothetical protein
MSKRKLLEPVTGRYTPIPHSVLDSVAFIGCSQLAKALLFELLRQHSGWNNGRLHLAVSWLRRRGWRSNASIQKGKDELLDRSLIYRTRRGGLTVGADYFALTWLSITDYRDLDVTRATYPQGLWASLDPLPSLAPRSPRSVNEDGLVPPPGTGTTPFVPCRGTKTRQNANTSIPPRGNNECCQLSEASRPRRARVVGAKGRSGKKRPAVLAR